MGFFSNTSKLLPKKKLATDSLVSSPRGAVNSRGHLSPIRGSVRLASLSKLRTSMTSSLLRGSSPSRMSTTVAGTTQSFLSFAADVRRGKIGDNRIVDAHLLILKILESHIALMWAIEIKVRVPHC
ncbi:Protein SNOWY COTYLEDON 3 [Morella rubra]|uniref:Protein SNOWY COTYLEDON 3 n=1 Tax=Morella rubra TaxID=262757 RepID=A0A6A1WPE9_9ROSI|nr:Protein SNOWY COTYLEDON 3 [Morella rubra]